MEEKAVGGVRWTMLTYAVGKVVTFVATVVLARILVPADFGVVMLAFVAMNVVGLFGDLGLGPTLVVRQDLDGPAMGTVLTMLLASGAALAVLLIAVSPLLSDAFHEPRLQSVLIALAPLNLLGSLNWFYQWRLQRDLEFRRRFYGFAAQTVAYAAVAVGSAIAGAGVWSIVAGHFAGHVAMAATYLLLSGLVRPTYDSKLARSLLRTSRGFLLQTGTTLLQGDIDYVAVGRTLGSAQLGLYSMAFRVSELLYLAIADPVAKVTFPGFTRMRARGEDVSASYLEVLRLIALVTCPLGAVLSATATEFTQLVYGPKWVGMASALTVLAVWGAVRCLKGTVEWFLNAVGGETTVGVVGTIMLAVQIPLLFVASAEYGIAGTAWVILGAAAMAVVLLAASARWRVDVGLVDQVRAVLPVAIASTGAWFAARGATRLPMKNELISLLIPVLAGGIAYVGLVSVLAPGALVRAVGLARRVAFGSGRDAGDAEAGSTTPDAAAPVRER